MTPGSAASFPRQKAWLTIASGRPTSPRSNARPSGCDAKERQTARRHVACAQPLSRTACSSTFVICGETFAVHRPAWRKFSPGSRHRYYRGRYGGIGGNPAGISSPQSGWNYRWTPLRWTARRYLANSASLRKTEVGAAGEGVLQPPEVSGAVDRQHALVRRVDELDDVAVDAHVASSELPGELIPVTLRYGRPSFAV